MTTSRSRDSLRSSLSSMTSPFSSLILAAASPRSSVVTVPERVSRSPIDERLARATICRNQRHSLVSSLRRVYPSLICSLQNNFQMKNVCCNLQIQFFSSSCPKLLHNGVLAFRLVSIFFPIFFAFSKFIKYFTTNVTFIRFLPL